MAAYQMCMGNNFCVVDLLLFYVKDIRCDVCSSNEVAENFKTRYISIIYTHLQLPSIQNHTLLNRENNAPNKIIFLVSSKGPWVSSRKQISIKQA